jgi:hypothetical protein
LNSFVLHCIPSSPVIHAAPYQELIIISSNKESNHCNQTNTFLADVIIISSDKSFDSADLSDGNTNCWSDGSDANNNDVGSFDNAEYPMHARHCIVPMFLHSLWSRCCMLSRTNTIPTAATHPPGTTGFDSDGEPGGSAHEDKHHHKPLINVSVVVLKSLPGC